MVDINDEESHHVLSLIHRINFMHKKLVSIVNKIFQCKNYHLISKYVVIGRYNVYIAKNLILSQRYLNIKNNVDQGLVCVSCAGNILRSKMKRSIRKSVRFN